MSKSLADKLREAGFPDAGRGTLTHAPPSAFTLPKKGEFLYDPRQDWPLDEATIEDYHQNGVRQPLAIFNNGVDEKSGKPILLVVDGRRRVLHALEHNRRHPNKKLVLKFETVEAKDKGQLWLIALALNQREEETYGSLFYKAQAAKDEGQADENIRLAMRKSKPTYERIMRYGSLHPKVQHALDQGRLPLALIDDFRDIPLESQIEKLETLLASGATKTHELREALQKTKGGGTPEPAPERKKIWDRRKITLFRDTIAEACPDTKEALVAFTICDLFLGKTTTLKKSDYEHLKKVLEIVDKNGEDRRAKARAREEAKKNGTAPGRKRGRSKEAQA